MSWVSTAIATGGNLLGGIIGQNQTHRKNVKLWKMQAEYNSPVQQMQRLKAAGLNPHLVYGQSASGATGSMPTPADSTQYDYSNVGNELANNYATFQQLKLQKTKQAAEIARMQVQNTLDIVRTEREVLGRDLDKGTLMKKIEMAQLQNDNLRSDIETKAIGREKTAEEIKNLGELRKEIVTRTKLTDRQADKVLKDTEKVAQEIKNLVKQGKLTDAERALKEEYLRWYKMGLNPNSSNYFEKVLVELLNDTGIIPTIKGWIKNKVDKANAPSTKDKVQSWWKRNKSWLDWIGVG